ncbi:hypothetical protein MPF_1377 [Methanohalophilus portucalensis FDF-1]|uniref:Uncharacterized protein n=1 Tax=Methanohalophilus portucalensis FDF-1 TaxID=523843 RepID=A0A1L9C313_9EURY|nr:hypothetical protein MPF_1377 [Methanohalophilus portucalensis FDF-1]
MTFTSPDIITNNIKLLVLIQKGINRLIYRDSYLK